MNERDRLLEAEIENAQSRMCRSSTSERQRFYAELIAVLVGMRRTERVEQMEVKQGLK